MSRRADKILTHPPGMGGGHNLQSDVRIPSPLIRTRKLSLSIAKRIHAIYFTEIFFIKFYIFFSGATGIAESLGNQPTVGVDHLQVPTSSPLHPSSKGSQKGQKRFTRSAESERLSGDEVDLKSHEDDDGRTSDIRAQQSQQDPTALDGPRSFAGCELMSKGIQHEIDEAFAGSHGHNIFLPIDFYLQ